LGAFSAPVLTGFLIDATGGYGTAFGYATALAVFGIVLSWVIPDVITSTNTGPTHSNE
jgi:dipeptide/tripeptide permease